jgi:hypothetical protein
VDWAAWMSAAPPVLDAEAEGIAADLIFHLEQHEPLATRLKTICIGDNFVVFSNSKIVPAGEAEVEAAKYSGTELKVQLVRVEALSRGAPRARILVLKRRQNLFQLCKENRLNRRKLEARLESACRRIREFKNLGEARAFFQPLLTEGKTAI